MNTSDRIACLLAGSLSTYELRALGVALELYVASEARNGLRRPETVDLVHKISAATQLVSRASVTVDAPHAIARGGSSDSLYPMTSTDAAHLLGCTESNVRARANRGSLPAIRRNRRWRFNQAEILAAIKAAS